LESNDYPAIPAYQALLSATEKNSCLAGLDEITSKNDAKERIYGT